MGSCAVTIAKFAMDCGLAFFPGYMAWAQPLKDIATASSAVISEGTVLYPVDWSWKWIMAGLTAGLTVIKQCTGH